MDDEKKVHQPITPPSAETWDRVFRDFIELIGNVLVKLNAVLENPEPYLTAIGAKSWPDVLRILNELPAKSKEAMRQKLAKGWFFGWHDSMQSLVELVDRLSITPDHDIDQLMVEYYRANLQSFAEQLTADHPKRAAAIKAAVAAHTTMPDGGYFLSVPVFIAQADGILAEVIGIQQPMTYGADVVRSKHGMDASLLDLLYPFLELQKSPFAMSAKAREQLPKGDRLNRHEVLHGERSDYGTQMNSLKAFSFLVFVGLHIPAVLPKSGH